MNTKKEKILKMSKILDAFLKIGAIMAIMGIVGMIIAVIMAPSLGVTTFSISGIWGGAPINAGLDEFRAVMISQMLGMAVVVAILFIASFIFKDMSRASTPFTQKNANRLKVIALLAAGFSLIVQPVRMLLTLLFFPAANLHVSINLGYLIFAIMFFCLALVFEYGAELQQQSDETL